MAVERPARAKINLALHVVGQRGDGYHLLDSLVAFAEIGDTVRVKPAERLTLTVDGPMAASLPASDDNLVLRAARLFACPNGAAITLTKRLPVASGIGGGSADAAAALLALASLWNAPLPDAAQILSLGADVPVCLAGHPARMGGIGEVVTPLARPLPRVWAVLANPGVAVSTPQIFRQLAHKTNPPLPAVLPAFADAAALARFLHAQRNDLQGPAMALQPVIGRVLDALTAVPGALMARMSGSGATCFALFGQQQAADSAAGQIAALHPDWWVAAAALAD